MHHLITYTRVKLSLLSIVAGWVKTQIYYVHCTPISPRCILSGVANEKKLASCIIKLKKLKPWVK